MAIIRLKKRPDSIEAKAILDNGEEKTLSQKPLGSGGLSQNLFFERFQHGRYTIQLRLHWTKKSMNEYGDPTLDADIYDENGENYTESRKDWHHTSKTNDGGLWVYEWKFQNLLLRFKLGVVSERTQTAKARITNP